MYWNQNHQALCQGQPCHQVLSERLAQIAASTEAELITTAAGDYSLVYKSIPLHSLQGAATEADVTIRKDCKPRLGRPHLILGLGLGYVLDAAYQRSPGQIVVYEPDLPLLKFVLENVDLSEYLTSDRVWITTSAAEALAVLRPLIASEDPLDILAIPGYAQLLHAEIPPLMDELFKLVDERVRDFKTGQHFHTQWTHQFFQNLPYFSQTLPFTTVLAQHEGKPALIIGRGPSLDKALPDILALADSMTLISAGSALHRLYEAGITPDIAVFYDANGIQEQLHGLPTEYLNQIVFFISALTDTHGFTVPSKAKVLFYPQSGIAFADWLASSQAGSPHSASAFSAPLVLEGGGTVSLIGMQVAQALHSSQIILVGQDLAFPNNQVYAGGIPVQQDAEGRLALVSSKTLHTAPEAMTTVIGQDGEPLPALKAYASFIHHFERLANENAQKPSPTLLYNASLGGAALQGFELKPLDAFRGQFPSYKPINSGDTEHLATADYTAQASTGLRLALSHLRQNLNEAITLHERTLQPDKAKAKLAGQLLFDFLNQNPLISHFLMFEMISTQQRYAPNANSLEALASNQALLAQSSRNCVEILKNQILPSIIQAECKLLNPSHSKPQAEIIPFGH